MSASRRLTRGLVCVLPAAALLAADAHAADEMLARRLGALKVLARVGRPPVTTPRVTSGCRNAAWWRETEYGVKARTDSAIRDASLRFSIDESLIRSVIHHESRYNPEAVSHKGAMGLMQLMPGTARDLGVVCPFDPRENVLGGTRYLRWMRDRLGSWARAVAAYHCGPGCVEADRIPRVTRRYAERVLRGWRPHRYATVSFH